MCLLKARRLFYNVCLRSLDIRQRYYILVCQKPGCDVRHSIMTCMLDFLIKYITVINFICQFGDCMFRVSSWLVFNLFWRDFVWSNPIKNLFLIVHPQISVKIGGTVQGILRVIMGVFYLRILVPSWVEIVLQHG